MCFSFFYNKRCMESEKKIWTVILKSSQEWKKKIFFLNLLFTNDFTSFSFEQTNIKICFYFSFIKGEMKEFIWVRFFCGIFRLRWNEFSLLCPFLVISVARNDFPKKETHNNSYINTRDFVFHLFHACLSISSRFA